MEKIELKGVFHLIDISVSFGLVLIRNVEYDFDKLEPYNTDIIFGGVVYMELDTIFTDITISQGDNNDVEYFKQRSNSESIDSKNIFTLESKGKKFYIVAHSFSIESNNFDFYKTSLKAKWRNIDYETNTKKSQFKTDSKLKNSGGINTDYFDKEYTVKITIKFDFYENRENNIELLHRSPLFQHFNEKNGQNLIIETYQNELSYDYTISCSSKDFSEVLNTSLNLLLKDNSYDLVEEETSFTNLINQISYSLFLDYYQNGASLKIANNQLKKHKVLTGKNISFCFQNNQVTLNEDLGEYFQLYFTGQNAEIALRKIEESWSFLLSKKYIKIQQTEFHIFPDTNEAFFVVSIKKEFLSDDNQYSDIYSFLDVHHFFLSENNIEAYMVLLYRSFDFGNTLPERFSNAHLVIIKNSTPVCPSFLDIYKSFI